MISVKINEATLLILLMNRLKYWTTNSDVLELYEDYLKELIYSGCFDCAELDVDMMIDNLYINDTTIMDKEMLRQLNMLYSFSSFKVTFNPELVRRNYELFSKELKNAKY